MTLKARKIKKKFLNGNSLAAKQKEEDSKAQHPMPPNKQKIKISSHQLKKIQKNFPNLNTKEIVLSRDAAGLPLQKNETLLLSPTYSSNALKHKRDTLALPHEFLMKR